MKNTLQFDLASNHALTHRPSTVLPDTHALSFSGTSSGATSSNDSNFNWLGLADASAPITRVLAQPLARLQQPTTSQVSLVFAKDGVHLPVIGTKAAGIKSTRTFIANAGAANSNARDFHARLTPDSAIAQQVRKDEGEFGLRSLLLAGRVDRYITAHGLESRENVIKSLELTKATAQAAKLDVPRKIQVVPTLFPTADLPTDPFELLDKPEELMLQVLEPHALAALLPETMPSLERQGWDDIALNNLAGYRKDATAQLWAADRLPVPDTVYLDPKARDDQPINDQAVAQLQKRFSAFADIVVSRVDGAGGEGICLMPVTDINADALTHFAAGEKLMLQGRLPLVASPNVIANLDNNNVEIKLMTNQVFKNFGANAGNAWPLAPEFSSEVQTLAEQALRSLQKAGVRGQVNIDILAITPQSQKELGLANRLFLREANTRPASSSVMLHVLEKGKTPRGGNVESIFMTASSPAVPIPFEKTQSKTQLHSFLRAKINHPGIGVVITQYNSQTQKANVILFGDDTASQADLQTSLSAFTG